MSKQGLRLLRVFGVLASCASAIGGCSNRPAAPVVTAGPMPAGGTWQGVYVNAVKGELDVVVSGRRADGVWHTPDGVRGSLWGAIDGNALRYMWSEGRKNERGEPIAWFGRGYFVYKVVDLKTQIIAGEWGLDENEVGNPWKAVKRIGQEPKLDGGADADEGSEDSGGSGCYDGCDEEQ